MAYKLQLYSIILFEELASHVKFDLELFLIQSNCCHVCMYVWCKQGLGVAPLDKLMFLHLCPVLDTSATTNITQKWELLTNQKNGNKINKLCFSYNEAHKLNQSEPTTTRHIMYS